MKPLVRMPAICIVDDDDAVRDSLDLYLTLKGMRVRTFRSGPDILKCKNLHSDILILDINMPEIDGFALLEKLRAQGHLGHVIFITGMGDMELRLRATRAGAAAFLDKPIDPLLLLATLNHLHR
jgi:FixJ family two-component response regulator